METGHSKLQEPMLSVNDMGTESHAQNEVLTRVGLMTRTLHENLRTLEVDQLAEKVARDIPNARGRLDYVARMTEHAAQRVLNATDAAGPLQDQIDRGASALASDWQAALSSPFSQAQYSAMAERTLDYLNQSRMSAGATKQHLMEIMMAQDFQDLTGQVIKKITELAHGLEQQLLQLLVDYAPPEIRRDAGSGLLNGPQISLDAGADMVADQRQVDDLLESLGF